MPWIPTEQKERKHSKPVRDRYAKSARAHREAIRNAPHFLIVMTVIGLVAAYACVLYLLIK